MNISARGGRIVMTVLALAIGALFTGAAPLAADKPPASAFARLPATGMARLSPDGHNVAWVDFTQQPAVISIFDLERKRVLRRMRVDEKGEVTVRDLAWADEDTLLLTVSVTYRPGDRTTSRDVLEFFRILALDTGGGPTRIMLTQHPYRRYVTATRVIQTHVGRPNTIIMASFEFNETAHRQETGSRLTGGRKDSGWVYSLFEVDTGTGAGKRIAGGTSFTDGWIVDREGSAVARIEWNPLDRKYQILVQRDGGWKPIYTAAHGSDLHPEGLAPGGEALVAIGARGGDRERAWRIPLDGGEITPLSDERDDVEFTIADRYTGEVAGLQVGGLAPQVRWLDTRLDGIHRAVAKAFPGQAVWIYDRSKDYGRVLARVEAAASPPVYYLVDLKRGTADTVGEVYPELIGVTLGERQELTYPARDGFSIPAYLTLPPGLQPEKLPLVVFPHGGPYARDDAGFDWWTQFMATRGYAVLQPQFRGSTGFGATLQRAGERAWGQAMQDDLADGVAMLVERGIADPKRICIVGASYGGYAALSGAAFNPELYACAVSVNGISDLPNMYGYLRNFYGDESDTLAEWKKLVGRALAPELEKFSPARAAAAIRVPVLLMHGTDDMVVPYAQSQSMAKALADARKPHELVPFKNEDHWLSSPVSRTLLLQKLEAFLAENLAPRQ